MDPNTHLERAVAQAKKIVAGVRDDQLTAPTPCSEWDVKALLAHLVGGALMSSAAAREGSVPQSVMQQVMSPDLVGDDFREKYSAAADEMLDAFRDPAVAGKMIELPFGTMPGQVVHSIFTLDTAIHAADLAHATGQSFDDAELAEASLEVGRRNEQMMGDALRSPNVFGPEQPCHDDAPATTRLLAFAGRKV
jgi:uncharacterized protein (TIGR03086 family)